MAELKTTKDSLDFLNEGKPVMSTGLNVITILTIIGCVIGLIGSVYSFATAEKSYREVKAQVESGKLDDAPEFMKSMLRPEMVNMMRKSYENKLPILLISLAGIGLCLWGAIEMRKLKKQGYFLWLAGEVIPIVGTVAILGTAALSGFGLIALIIPIIFIILYTVFKKDLVY